MIKASDIEVKNFKAYFRGECLGGIFNASDVKTTIAKAYNWGEAGKGKEPQTEKEDNCV